MKRFIRFFSCAKTAQLQYQLFLLLHFLVAATVTNAADLVGYHATWSDNTLLFQDDLISGAQQAIGPMGIGYVRELAFSRASGLLYAITDPGDLYRVDKSTGVASLIRAGTIPRVGLSSISFAPNGVLYASNGTSLYTVDTTSGISSLVGDLNPYISTRTIAFDQTGAGIGYDGGAGWLFHIDATDASTSSIGYFPSIDVNSLAYGPDNRLYGWYDRSLYTIDPASLTATRIHTYVGMGGQAFTIAIPEPAAAILGGIGAGALAFAGLRRRRPLIVH